MSPPGREEDVEVFFKVIPDMELLRQERPLKEDFPFYGWAVMSFDSTKKELIQLVINGEVVRETEP